MRLVLDLSLIPFNMESVLKIMVDGVVSEIQDGVHSDESTPEEDAQLVEKFLSVKNLSEFQQISRDWTSNDDFMFFYLHSALDEYALERVA